MDQNEYDILRDEIYANGNLSDPDRLKYFDLHQKVNVPDNTAFDRLVYELRNRKKGNDRIKLSIAERKYIFNYLEWKRVSGGGLNRFEYNYLQFLRWRHGFPTAAEAPCLPSLVRISLNEFLAKFSVRGRESLISVFKNGLKRVAEVYDLVNFDIIVGGSFVNLKKEKPGDIDVVVLLPIEAFHQDYGNRKLKKIIDEFQDTDGTNLFDLLKLPVPYTDDLYMAYELLTLLSNDPTERKKEGIVNESYQCIDIFQISINSKEI